MYLTFLEKEKWDGFNLPFLDYVRRLYQKCQAEYEITDSRIPLYHILVNTIELLQTLWLLNVNCSKRYRDTVPLQQILLRFQTTPSTQAERHEEKFEIKPGSRTLSEDISFFLQQEIRNSVKGFAKEVIDQFNIDHRSRGIDMLFRLLEVFETSPAQVALIPYLFEWGKEEIYKSWCEYKKALTEQNFFAVHPTMISTAILRAKFGFDKYEEGPRLLDYLRISLGDGHEYEWKSFEREVEKFLGDPYRRNFVKAVIDNDVSNQVNGLDAHWQQQPIEKVCQIKNYKSEPNVYPDLKFLKTAFKIIKKQKDTIKKTTKGKKIPPVCGWCGQNHPYWLCHKKGGNKWEKHHCTNCGGKGHPKAVCTSPLTEDGHLPSDSPPRSIFLLTSPTGVYTIDVPEMKSQNKNLFMLDSGAAISVAPYAEFKNVKLQKDERHMYHLQSATGKKLQIYGTKDVPFQFGNDTIYIKVVICDVTIPLLSTNDMIQKGISVYLDKNTPYLHVNGNKYKLFLQNKHFWMKQFYNNKGGSFGFTHKQHEQQTNHFKSQNLSDINQVAEKENSKIKQVIKANEIGDVRNICESCTTQVHVEKTSYKEQEEQCDINVIKDRVVKTQNKLVNKKLVPTQLSSSHKENGNIDHHVPGSSTDVRPPINDVPMEVESTQGNGNKTIQPQVESTTTKQTVHMDVETPIQKTTMFSPLGTTSRETTKQNDGNFIIVPNKLELDPEYDQIIQNYGESVDDVTNKKRKPAEIVKLNTIPKIPSDEAVQKHNVSHIPHERWCKHCVEGRMVKDHSLTVPKSERLLRTGIVVQMDFFSIDKMRILVCVETTSSYVYARKVDEKTFTGSSDQKVSMVEDFLRDMGKRNVTLQCDGESTLRYLVDTVAERFTSAKGPNPYNITGRYTSAYTSNSNGSAERAIRLVRDQLRVMFGALCHKHNENFDPKSKLIPWLVRHATYLINRLIAVKALGDQTRYEVLFGKKYNKNNLYEFLIPVVLTPQDRKKSKYKTDIYKQQPLGLYLGRFEKMDNHIVLTDDGKISYSHTVKLQHMDIEQQREILRLHDETKATTAQEQHIYDQTSIQPRFDAEFIVARRAVGSKTRFEQLDPEIRTEARQFHGPTVERKQPHPMAINPENKQTESKMLHLESGPVNPRPMKAQRTINTPTDVNMTDNLKRKQPEPLYSDNDDDITDPNAVSYPESQKKILKSTPVTMETQKEPPQTNQQDEEMKPKTSSGHKLNMERTNVKNRAKEMTTEKQNANFQMHEQNRENDVQARRQKLQNQVTDGLKTFEEKCKTKTISEGLKAFEEECKQTDEPKIIELSSDEEMDPTPVQTNPETKPNVIRDKTSTPKDTNSAKQNPKKVKIQKTSKQSKTKPTHVTEKMKQNDMLERSAVQQSAREQQTTSNAPPDEQQGKPVNTKTISPNHQNLSSNTQRENPNLPKQNQCHEPENMEVELKTTTSKPTSKATATNEKKIKSTTKNKPVKVIAKAKAKQKQLPKMNAEVVAREGYDTQTLEPILHNPERFTEDQLLGARERAQQPLPIDFAKDLKENELLGYTIRGGQLYNPLQQKVTNGWNEDRNEFEDDLRSRAGLTRIGGPEKFAHVENRKRIREHEIENTNKKNKQQEDDVTMTDETMSTEDIQDQIMGILNQKNQPKQNRKIMKKWLQLLQSHIIASCKETCTTMVPTSEVFNTVTLVLDETNVPSVTYRMFSNMFNNHMLAAVTVSKRQMKESNFPDKWAEARKKEMDSLKKFEVFEVVDLQEVPNNHPVPIGCRWLYTLKDYPYDTYQKNNPEAEGKARHKARLIVQGMNEKIEDTYSPTPSAESVRICLTLAQIGKWRIKFSDVSTAFLHADVIGNPYVYPPETERLENTTKVWKLNKALYGLKSAPKAWYDHVSKLLIKIGWRRSVLDECVFYKVKHENVNLAEIENDFMYNSDSEMDDSNCEMEDMEKFITKTEKMPISGMITIYVDDLIVAGEDDVQNHFFTEFSKSVTFSEPEELTVGGEPITFLGFQYRRQADYIEIDPTEYTQKVLEAFKHTEARPLKTVGEPGEYIYDPAERKTLKKDGPEHKSYRRLVGQLLWLSGIRRDISYAVKELSKYVHDPTSDDVKRANHVLRYLNGTKDEKVYLRPNKQGIFTLEAYTDADLGSCRTTRKSTSGGCLSLNGSIVFTWAKQQDTVADSSTESEYLAMVHACKQVKYVQQFLDELNIILGEIPILHIDNTSSMEMVRGNAKSRVKHLDRKKYWIRDFITNQNIVIKYVETKNNIADLFTKYVTNTVLEKLRPAIMGREEPPRTSIKDVKMQKVIPLDFHETDQDVIMKDAEE